MRAFLKFNKGVLRLPLPVRLWMMLGVSINMIVPLFFIHRPEAQVVLASFLAAFMLMTTLCGVFGFNRLMGVGHVFWIPMIVFLLMRLGEIPANDAFGIWVRIIIGYDAVSLLFDGADLVRYIRGDRAEIVKGL